MNSGKVSIITVNYNQPELTIALLASLSSSIYEDLELIVVDNASKKDPRALFLAQYPNIVYIRSEENLGFSGGNNLGIEKATGEYLFFVNNDTEVPPNTIGQLVDFCRREPSTGAVSPKIYFYDSLNLPSPTIQYIGSTPVHPMTARNKTIGEGETDNGQYDDRKETAYIHGAAMMVPRKVIDKVGLMPEVYFLYYEELDWCESFRRAGYQLFVLPQATIYHKESQSVGKHSLLQTHYLTRNRILFMRRNRNVAEQFAFWLFLCCFTVPKNAISFILKGEWARLNTFWKAILWNLKTPLNTIENKPVRTFES